MDNKFGVINEQGYVAGSFGFDPISEEDDSKIKSSESRTTEKPDYSKGK